MGIERIPCRRILRQYLLPASGVLFRSWIDILRDQVSKKIKARQLHMIRQNPRLFAIITGLAMLCIVPSIASACPSCYGAADSPMIDGMNMAIMSMVGIVGFVLTGFVTVFFMIRRRMKKLSETPSSESNINNEGVIRWNNF